jgi:large subunit ribosomal protein L15
MPLHRRLPKKGFSNATFKDKVAIVNVSQLEIFEDGTEINEALLRERGLVRGRIDAVKLLGEGDLSKKLVVSVDRVSASAKEKIEKSGGSVVVSV